MSYSDRFDEALAYAHALHREQTRKGGGAPYIGHLLAVAALVIDAGADEEVAIAALLHDAVEDQGGSKVLGEIERRFGARAAAIVEGCSDWSGDGAKPPWRRRKEHHIARLAAAGPDVQLVAAADKLHNLRSLIADYRARGETVWPRFNGGRAGTLWYYRQVADALGAAGVPPALGEALAGAVDEIEGLAANVKRADRVEN
jgi:(p)ppGpp synthase/HD superfamily hydrolase